MRKPASWKQEAAACRKRPPQAAFSDKTRFPCAFGAAGETCLDSEYSSEGCGPPNLPEGFLTVCGFLETGSRFFLSPQRLAALPGPRSHTPPFSNSALKQKIGHHDFCISVQRKQKRSGRACVRCSFSVFCSISPLPFRLEKPFLRCLRTLLFQEGKLAIIWIKFLKNLLKWA